MREKGRGKIIKNGGDKGVKMGNFVKLPLMSPNESLKVRMREVETTQGGRGGKEKVNYIVAEILKGTRRTETLTGRNVRLRKKGRKGGTNGRTQRWGGGKGERKRKD